jgi:hypothetical protein
MHTVDDIHGAHEGIGCHRQAAPQPDIAAGWGQAAITSGDQRMSVLLARMHDFSLDSDRK